VAQADVLLRTLPRPGKVLKPWGVEHTAVDLADVDALRAALRPETKAVWCETPTNPRGPVLAGGA